MKKIVSKIKQKTKNLFFESKPLSQEERIELYVTNGRVPWSVGYNEYKSMFIKNVLNENEVLQRFKNNLTSLSDFAIGLDERAVEYPWIFSRLSQKATVMLDAGSTFNFDFIVEHELIKNKKLTIFTFHPEKKCFFNKGISYVYGDLREMYFKNNAFEEIVSHSTIEHIGMDNAIYGYGDDKNRNGKSFEYLKAIEEMIRILKPGGKLLITFPFGKYEDHGFFQQFDLEMLQKLLSLFSLVGKFEVDYFKYEKSGWRFASQSELASIESFNPHSGRGKGEDGAAHCRSIACIEFIKHS